MRDSVRAAFRPFASPFEGLLSFMYLDTKCLVTTGMGNLIDPMGPALGLPWVHKLDGTAAARAEIVAEWTKVKGATSMARLGGGAFARLTTLCLTSASIDQLVVGKLSQIETAVRSGFGEWDSFPASAQLAILDMAWNMGSAFGFPHFRLAVNAGNWLAAGAECKIVDASADRNDAHVALFKAAAAGGDPDALAC